MRRLGVFLGPDKAGSTWLYRVCVWHPEAVVARSKELFFFDRYFGRGLQWYEAQFPVAKRQSAIAVDLSHDYLFSHTAARRLAGTFPHARLLVIARNPVERARSAYLYMQSQGRHLPPPERAFQDLPELLDHGLYGKYLQYWLTLFPSDQVSVVDFSQLVSDPEAFASSCLHALGATYMPTLPPELLGPVNVARQARSPVVVRYGRQFGWHLRNRGFQALVQRAKDSSLLRRLLFSKIGNSEAIRNTLVPPDHIVARLREDARVLDQLFGTSFDEDWYGTVDS